MSSTNRGRERNKYDYYVTPKNEVRKFLKVFLQNNEIKGNILDPCAGGDLNHGMTYPEAINEIIKDCKVKTLDIRPDSRAEYKNIDYLKTDISELIEGYKPNAIFTNPPFNLAMDFIKKALEEVNENGFVIMLLRLNFLGSESRNTWLKNNMPYEIYVHSKRMSFTGDGKTDSIEYAHFIWKKGHKGATKLYLLDY